jgi:ferrous iron transport protein A
MLAGEVRAESGEVRDGQVRDGQVRDVPWPRGRPAGGSLADLAPGARAVVLAVSPSGGRETARRLLDLGFSPGTAVEVMRRAPLRDPVVYRLRGYDICLRRAQAGLIRVAAA